MFRNFSDTASSDTTRSTSTRRREQHIPSTTKGAGVHKTSIVNSRSSNGEKFRVVRDRTNETQTTAGESHGTVSSLSGIYSADLLKEIYPPSDSESEYSGYNAAQVKSNENDFIVSISKNKKVFEEVDLDKCSDSTMVVGNFHYTIPYINQPSMLDIVKSSSWMDDKPFDEESILNMSDLGDEKVDAATTSSYYSKNFITTIL
jgi:hypothetical protein